MRHHPLFQIQRGVTEAVSDNDAHWTPLSIKLGQFGDTLTLIGAIFVAVWVTSIPKFQDHTCKAPVEGVIYYVKMVVVLGLAAVSCEELFIMCETCLLEGRTYYRTMSSSR